MLQYDDVICEDDVRRDDIGERCTESDLDACVEDVETEYTGCPGYDCDGAAGRRNESALR